MLVAPALDRSLRDEHFPAAVVVRSQLLQLSRQRQDIPDFVGLRFYERVLTDEDVWERFQTTALDRRLERAAAADLRLSPGADVRQPVPAAARAPHARAGADDALVRLGRRLLQALLRADLRPAQPVGSRFLPASTFAILGAPTGAIIAIVIADAWMWAPFVMLLVLAGLGLACRNTSTRRRRSIGRHGGGGSARSPSPISAACCCSPCSSAPSRPSSSSTSSTSSPRAVRARRRRRSPSITYRLAFQFFRTSQSAALAYIILFVVIVLTNLYLYAVKQREREVS